MQRAISLEAQNARHRKRATTLPDQMKREAKLLLTAARSGSLTLDERRALQPQVSAVWELLSEIGAVNLRELGQLEEAAEASAQETDDTETAGPILAA